MSSTAWKDLVSGEQLVKAAKNRNTGKIFESCAASDLDGIEKLKKAGFVEKKQNSRTVTLSRDKDQSVQFEDAVWNVFYKVGFTHMNGSSNFGIEYHSNPERDPKQIDVFAYDGNVAIVVECKCAQEPDTDFSFKEVLDTIKGYKEDISDSIKEHFNNQEVDIAFCLITKNYNVSPANLRIAKGNGISMLNEYDLKYYSDLYKSLGEFAKNQILSDIFRDKPPKSIQTIVPAIKTTMAGNVAYTFFIQPAKLLPLAYVAHRRPNDPDMDKSYQRMIRKSSLKSIRQYIKQDGFFANNIIVNISTTDGCYFETNDEGPVQKGTLHLPDHFKSIWVIDGQHRLYSYSGMPQAETSVVAVTAFEQMDPETQSRIFLDINSTQKKVNPNLLCAVDAKAKFKSDVMEDWAPSLNVVIFEQMSEDPSSALYGKVKRELDPSCKGVITIKSLRDVMNKTKLIGSLNKAKMFEPGPLYHDKPSDEVREATIKKTKIFFEKCFRVFKDNCGELWDKEPPNEGYLCTPNGMTALILTINECLQIAFAERLEERRKISAEQLFTPIKKYLVELANCFNSMSIDDINRFRKRQGAAGQNECYMDMLLIIHEKYPSFKNEKIESYIEHSDARYAEEIKEKLPEFKNEIVESVSQLLISKYGENWHRMPNYSTIGSKLNQLRYEKGSSLDSLEDFIDYDIALDIIKSSNWKDFSKYFGVKRNGAKTKDAQTKWMNTIASIEKDLSLDMKIRDDTYNEFESIFDELMKRTGQIDLEEEDLESE